MSRIKEPLNNNNSNDQTQVISKSFVYSIFIGMVLSGSCSALLIKYQTSVIVDGQSFNHPYMSSLIMFFAEASLFVLYKINKFRNPEDEEKAKLVSQASGKSLKTNWFMILVPTVLDTLDSTVNFLCIAFIPVSIVKIIGSGKLVVTAAYSRLFLKVQITNNQYLGVGITLTGMIFVALSSFLDTSDSSTNSFWLIVYILNQFIAGGVNVTSQWGFQKMHIHQMKMIGGQGLWGILIMAILIPIMNFVPCSMPSGCVIDEDTGKQFMEQTSVWASQLSENSLLLISIIVQFFIFTLFNYFAITVTKYVGAMAQAVNVLMQTFIVWTVGIIVTKANPNNQQFQWENIKTFPILMEGAGCLVIVGGNLVYNGIIMIMKQRNLEENTIVEDFQKSYYHSFVGEETQKFGNSQKRSRFQQQQQNSQIYQSEIVKLVQNQDQKDEQEYLKNSQEKRKASQ